MAAKPVPRHTIVVADMLSGSAAISVIWHVVIGVIAEALACPELVVVSSLKVSFQTQVPVRWFKMLTAMALTVPVHCAQLTAEAYTEAYTAPGLVVGTLGIRVRSCWASLILLLTVMEETALGRGAVQRKRPAALAADVSLV